MAVKARAKPATGEQVRQNLEKRIADDFADLPEGQLPEGYQPVKADRVNAWWAPAGGGILMGTVKGRFMQRGKDGRAPSAYYQIVLSRPTTGRMKPEGSNEWDDCEVSKGELINVKETWELQFLAPILEKAQEESFGVSVFVRPVGKESIGGGQTVWHYDIAWKKEDAPF